MKITKQEINNVINYYAEFKASKEGKLPPFFSVAQLEVRHNVKNINGFLRQAGAIDIEGRGRSAKYTFISDHLEPIMARRTIKYKYNYWKDKNSVKNKNRKMNKTTRASDAYIEKLHNSLVELYRILGYTNVISLNSFCIKNKLSKSLPEVLKNSNIIKLEGGKNNPIWFWIGGAPDRDMTINVIRKLSEDTAKPYRSVSKTIAMPPQELSYSETRYLFGLIKIRTYHYYK